jgi:hypothetical protein
MIRSFFGLRYPRVSKISHSGVNHLILFKAPESWNPNQVKRESVKQERRASEWYFLSGFKRNQWIRRCGKEGFAIPADAVQKSCVDELRNLHGGSKAALPR